MVNNLWSVIWGNGDGGEGDSVGGSHGTSYFVEITIGNLPGTCRSSTSLLAPIFCKSCAVCFC